MKKEAVRPAENHRKHYTDADIATIWYVAKTPEGRRRLAEQLGRTEYAIDFVWRWMDGADFPEEAGNQIARQVADCRDRLGAETRGKVVY